MMIGAIRRVIPFSNSTGLRLTVVAALMVGFVAVGFIASRWGAVAIIVAAAPLVLAVAMNRPQYSVLALLLTAAFVRASLPTGTQSRIVASLVLTAALTAIWLTRMFVVEKRVQLIPARTNAPVLGIVVVSFVSYLWSNVFRDPLVVVWKTWPVVQLGALGVMVFLPCAFLLTVNSITDAPWLKVSLWATVGIGTASVVLERVGVDVRFINTGGLFSLWLVSLAYAQVLFNKRLSWAGRIVLLALMGFWLYRKFIVEVYWFSGWLPSLIAIGVISFLRSKRLFVIFVLVVVVYLALNWGYYFEAILSRESEESGMTRLAAWKVNWRVTGRHLLLGTGPAGYAAYYMSYFPNEAMATHSNYIDILSQLGVVGMAFYVWFLIALVVTGVKVWKRMREDKDVLGGLAAGTLAGTIGLIIAMGLGDWFVPFAYTQTIAGFDYAVYGWIWLGLMVSLERIGRERAGEGWI